MAPAPSVLAAYRFVADAPGARRELAVASLWLLIPIAGWLAVSGWLCEVQHRLVVRHPSPLPRLDLRDLPHYVRRGAPAWFVEHSGLGLLAVLGAALSFVVNAGSLAAWLAAAGSMAFWLVLGGGLLVFAAVMALGTSLLNAVLTRAELSEELGVALAPGVLGYARQTWRPALLGYLGLTALAAALLAAGGLLCGVGALPAYVASRLAALHLRWQLYERHGRPRRALPEPKPPVLLPSERRALALPSPAPRERVR